MRDGYVVIDRCPIYYRLDGIGKKELLFLHGNGEDMHIFDQYAALLSDAFTVCRMDSRCHGRSGGAYTTLSIPRMAEDTAQLIKKLGLNKPHLIGFSDGANIAMQVAAENGRLIDRLVLAGGNMEPEGLLPHVLDEMRAQVRALRKKEQSGCYDGQALALLRLMTEEPRLTAEILEKIQAKTLVIAGENDVISASHTKKIADAIPDSTLQILPDSDHFVFSRPAVLLSVLYPFLCEKESNEEL